mgnify:CR=1 FL=1
MTLLQLKYVVEVAAAGTISGAAKKLYIAQPSLTAAIKELEHAGYGKLLLLVFHIRDFPFQDCPV